MTNIQNIVIFGLQPWDISIGSNCKNIALEMSKKHRVLYVNRPLDRVTQFRKNKSQEAKNRIAVLKGKQPALQKVNKNLWVLNPPIVLESIQWINSYSIFNFLNSQNNKRLARCILKYAKDIGFEDFILFNDSAMFQGGHLKDYLRPKKMIYYIRDYLIAQPYFSKHGPKAEAQLASSADVVVTNSSYLANYARNFNSNSHFVGQGCDFSIFDTKSILTRPPQLLDEKRPIIGYVGFLTSKRLDIQLLEKMAKIRPNYCFVLVGPEDEAFKESRLHNLSNVRFLGYQSPETLPEYINSFDVCINPQLINQLSIGNYPRKIDEYLALGKPTIATRTDAMSYFKDYVYLSDNLPEWIQNIDKAIKEDDINLQEKRITFARSHTWENSVQAIYNVCPELA